MKLFNFLILFLFFVSAQVFAFNPDHCDDFVLQHIQEKFWERGISDRAAIMGIDFEMEGPFNGYGEASAEVRLVLKENEASYIAMVEEQGGTGIDRYIVDKTTCELKRTEVLYSE